MSNSFLPFLSPLKLQPVLCSHLQHQESQQNRVLPFEGVIVCQRIVSDQRTPRHGILRSGIRRSICYVKTSVSTSSGRTVGASGVLNRATSKPPADIQRFPPSVAPKPISKLFIMAEGPPPFLGNRNEKVSEELLRLQPKFPKAATAQCYIRLQAIILHDGRRIPVQLYLDTGSSMSFVSSPVIDSLPGLRPRQDALPPCRVSATNLCQCAPACILCRCRACTSLGQDIESFRAGHPLADDSILESAPSDLIKFC